PDFNGRDGFFFRANDGALDSNIARIILTVTPVNDAPVAQDGSAEGNEDTPITGALVATDIDSPVLTYNVVTQAAHGTVVLDPAATFLYTQHADFNGSDSFAFSANDGSLDSNIASVSLTVHPVNDAPVAQDGSARGDEDTKIFGMLIATDIDSPTLD